MSLGDGEGKGFDVNVDTFVESEQKSLVKMTNTYKIRSIGMYGDSDQINIE